MEHIDADTLAGYVDARLSAEKRAEVERHIDACATCRSELSTLALLRSQAAAESDTLPSTDRRGEDYGDLTTISPEHYTDRIEITRGGMGRIIAARDRRLKRKVALKELRSVSAEAKARFEREVLLTARLQHPSIVSIHEAGMWPSGEPFYAMKLVPGRSLDQAIDAATTVEARMALLPHVIAVADALAYAHEQGVIHRDLKPHNVMIGEFGETVVIDWGLAKDLGVADPTSNERHVAASDAETEVGVVMGTPAYMPPEQAAGDPVDERADVYAIGALLYHTLTGEAPYSGRTSAAILAAVTAGPPPPIAELQPGLPIDLITIVSLAMSRDPAARYPSAKPLAEDLRRFQAGQLVSTHRYSTRELVRRWLRRHRTAVSVAAVSMLVLVVLGIIGVRRILSAQHEAEAERRVAEAQRAAAESHRADAEDLMGFMLGDLREKLQPVGKLDLLDTVASKARDYYKNRPETTDAGDLLRRATAHRNLGDVILNHNDTPGALAEYRAALALTTKLPSTEEVQQLVWRIHRDLGAVLQEQGDLAGALRETQTVVDMLEHMGPSNGPELAISYMKVADVFERQSDLTRALAEYRKGVTLAETLARTAPAEKRIQQSLASGHFNVGFVLSRQGHIDEALAEQRASLAIDEQLAAADPSDMIAARGVSFSHTKVGALLLEKHDTTGALAEFRAALAVRARLAALDPTNATWQRDLASSNDDIGDVFWTRKDPAAEAAYRTALAIREQLVKKDPSNALLRQHLAVSHYHLGDLLLDRHDGQGALAAFRASLADLEWIVAQDASNAGGRQDVADARRKVAEALLMTGDVAAATAEFQTALAVFEDLSRQDPSNAEVKEGIAEIKQKLPH
jgi:tetratricopeptide (TPR) repeat protein